MKTPLVLIVLICLVAAAAVSTGAFAVIKVREGRQLRAENAGLAVTVSQLTEQISDLQRRTAQRRTSESGGSAATAAAPATGVAAAPQVTAPPAADPSAAQKEKEIAALRQQLAQTQRNAAPRDRGSVTNRMQAYWTKLKEENPEEYDRMQKERQQRRDDAASAVRERTAFLKAVPTEGLTDEYLQNHRALVERMDFYNQAMAQIAADPDSEVSRELRSKMFENMRGMGELLTKERTILLSDLAQQIGYKSAESQGFVDYVNYVNEITSMPDGPRMFGRGRRQDGAQRTDGSAATPADGAAAGSRGTRQ